MSAVRARSVRARQRGPDGRGLSPRFHPLGARRLRWRSGWSLCDRHLTSGRKEFAVEIIPWSDQKNGHPSVPTCQPLGRWSKGGSRMAARHCAERSLSLTGPRPMAGWRGSGRGSGRPDHRRSGTGGGRSRRTGHGRPPTPQHGGEGTQILDHDLARIGGAVAFGRRPVRGLDDVAAFACAGSAVGPDRAQCAQAGSIVSVRFDPLGSGVDGGLRF